MTHPYTVGPRRPRRHGHGLRPGHHPHARRSRWRSWACRCRRPRACSSSSGRRSSTGCATSWASRARSAQRVARPLPGRATARPGRSRPSRTRGSARRWRRSVGSAPLAIATSKPESTATRILEHFGFAPLFTVIAGASDDETRSEKADVITRALELLAERGVDVSRPVMIGDRIHDVDGAAAHGIPSIVAGWGYGAPEEAAGAIAIAASPADLPGLVRRGSTGSPVSNPDVRRTVQQGGPGLRENRRMTLTQVERQYAKAAQATAPHVVVLFGAAGDLAKRKLLPGMANLVLSSLAPDIEIVGTSLEDLDDDTYREQAKAALDEFDRRTAERRGVAHFAEKLHYVPSKAGPKALAQAVTEAAERLGPSARRIHYLSRAPEGGPRGGRDHPRRGPRRGLPDHHGEAVRHRSGERRGAEPAAARDVRREPDLPDRPLPGQGAGAEHPRHPLRQRPVRAHLEPQLHPADPDRRAGDPRARAARAPSTRRPAPTATWS